MKDQVLEHIWQVRRSISEQNDFDSKKLVAYYKNREKWALILPTTGACMTHTGMSVSGVWTGVGRILEAS